MLPDGGAGVAAAVLFDGTAALLAVAAAVCPSTWTDEDPQPLPVAVRDRFLANLAWFQWAPNEAAACWAWLRELLS